MLWCGYRRELEVIEEGRRLFGEGECVVGEVTDPMAECRMAQVCGRGRETGNRGN